MDFPIYIGLRPAAVIIEEHVIITVKKVSSLNFPGWISFPGWTNFPSWGLKIRSSEWSKQEVPDFPEWGLKACDPRCYKWPSGETVYTTVSKTVAR
jgi:hypothetical protein